jgi:hypothetical protein
MSNLIVQLRLTREAVTLKTAQLTLIQQSYQLYRYRLLFTCYVQHPKRNVMLVRWKPNLLIPSSVSLPSIPRHSIHWRLMEFYTKVSHTVQRGGILLGSVYYAMIVLGYACLPPTKCRARRSFLSKSTTVVLLGYAYLSQHQTCAAVASFPAQLT